MRPKQTAWACVLVQQAPHGQSDRLGLVATSQALARFLDESHDFRTVDCDHLRHNVPIAITYVLA
jgi:hypothetical protein